MYCNNCGAIINKGAMFCQNCGALQASDKFTDIPKQEIKHLTRKGFTVIEWGGYEAE